MEALINNISNVLREYNLRFCEEISGKYGIDKDELIALSETLKTEDNEVKELKKIKPKVELKIESKVVSKIESKIESNVVSKIDEKVLAKSTKPQLTALCKERGLKVSGNKEELITRLLEFSVGQTEDSSANDKINKAANDRVNNKVNQSVKPETKKVKEAKEEQLLKKYAEQQNNTLEIRRNTFNNYEHSITKLVFRKEDKKVYGKQNDDGTVSELTKDDIEECKKYKFDYEIPLNLNKKTTLNDIKVEEVEEEEEVEVEEEEEVEEEDINEEDIIEVEEEEEYEEYEEDDE